MQTTLAIAAGLAVVTGIVHSLLGELLIFRHLRQGTVVPALHAPPLRQHNIRIIWATWHLATVFGWAFAGLLAQLALDPNKPLLPLVLHTTVAAYAGAAMLVLIATRGRHPGWIALLAVAALTWLAAAMP